MPSSASGAPSLSASLVSSSASGMLSPSASGSTLSVAPSLSASLVLDSSASGMPSLSASPVPSSASGAPSLSLSAWGGGGAQGGACSDRRLSCEIVACPTASVAAASRAKSVPLFARLGVSGSASNRENAKSTACANGTSYMAASPSIAPSAIACVVKWPSAGYSSTRPRRGAEEEKLWPTMPCGRERASPRAALKLMSRRCVGPATRS